MMRGNTALSNPPKGHPEIPAVLRAQPRPGYAEALRDVDFDAVRADLKALFKTSQEHWPSDYGHYGPFFIRLAWHCSGSYRTSDGRGGCGGGRQRFDPERSWDDNTNLDKARGLLWPIKEKYGLGLSWGDLFILAGTTAIESMGGPVLGFCAGRVDEENGEWSAELGPTPQQEAFAPCPVNGQCKKPLGSTTIGLIYVNPEGPMGQPHPELSAGEVRDTFGRMGMNDSETVALIGAHTFGKTHGACPLGPGAAPKDDPVNPWPGKCGTGRGNDTFTSGFEGPWTSDPTTFDNKYYQYLTQFQWEPRKGPGGHVQWHVANATSPTAPGPQGGLQDIMMLTTDVSLTRDPTGAYQPIISHFAQDQDAFGHAFMQAWYKLTTRDMGPVTRCAGKDVPPAQPWQFPLPPTPDVLANFTDVEADVRGLIGAHDGLGPFLVRLAWQCASTFRVTDYQGGCNGARIRFAPQKDWPVNAALDQALAQLQPLKQKYGDGLSWADLIVLGGTVGIELAGGVPMPFCPGRTDAPDGLGSQYLEPALSGAPTDSAYALKQSIKLMGLTVAEMAALFGGGHSIGAMHADRTGYTGSWTSAKQVSNEYFQNVLTEQWEPFTVPGTGKEQFKAHGKELYMLGTDLLFRYDAELQAAAQDFAEDNDYFLNTFAGAWVKMMNADRFSGPTGNVCHRCAAAGAQPERFIARGHQQARLSVQ